MTADAAGTKYYVRFSTAADADKLLEFYDDHAHKNVLKRDIALMKKLADEGSVVIVEDAAGKIVASSITYPHMDQDGVLRWHEIGTTRIALNGYADIFNAMVAMQVLRAFFFEPPADIFVAQMETAPVQGKAEALGWRRLKEMPDGLLDAKHRSLQAGAHSGANDWFGFGMEGMPVLAAWLENLSKNPELTNKKTGEKIELDFSRSTFFATFLDEIKLLAADKTLGSPDAFDAKQHLRERCIAWQKKNFR